MRNQSNVSAGQIFKKMEKKVAETDLEKRSAARRAKTANLRALRLEKEAADRAEKGEGLAKSAGAK